MWCESPLTRGALSPCIQLAAIATLYAVAARADGSCTSPLFFAHHLVFGLGISALVFALARMMPGSSRRKAIVLVFQAAVQIVCICLALTLGTTACAVFTPIAGLVFCVEVFLVASLLYQNDSYDSSSNILGDVYLTVAGCRAGILIFVAMSPVCAAVTGGVATTAAIASFEGFGCIMSVWALSQRFTRAHYDEDNY